MHEYEKKDLSSKSRLTEKEKEKERKPKAKDIFRDSIRFFF